ncbi:MAG: transporter related, partial [Massilia sp.]|nr:transporter related [Massilia sp.]
MSLTDTVRREDVLWALGSLCGFYRIPFDSALVAQQFPPPYKVGSFHEIARTLGIRSGSCELANVDWQQLPLPAVAFLRPEGEEGEEGGLALEASAAAVLVLKTDGKVLSVFRAGVDTPESITVEEAALRFAPSILLFGKAPEVGNGKDDEEIAGFTQEKKAFGFRWFVPELLKHKSIWRDVLLASLAIQLVGLATPLFTQAIIDKVVVHQTKNTLLVLGVGLLMFMVFTSVMTWLRQYLVLHTGNRIDAVLGSEVFRHMLRLPLPYFEQRPTGTLVARLQGVETIREFISGAAVTLI